MKLPEYEQSLWREAYPAPSTLYPHLEGDRHVDVAIVGAGITGLTAGYLLKRSGFTVAVLDKDTVGGGTTGRTTGKVTAQHGLIYDELSRSRGPEVAQAYADANQAAVEEVAAIIKCEKIECQWRPNDSYVFGTRESTVIKLRREAEIAAGLGLPASFVTEVPLPFAVAGAVKFAGQASFNAQQYVMALARLVDGGGSQVFEDSTVTVIHGGKRPFVGTSQGFVHAKHVIVATNVPTLPLMARGSYCLLEYPTESYIVAGRMPRSLGGMYISPEKSHYSVLPVEINAEPWVLVGGEGHLSGARGNKRARYERLARYAQDHFAVQEIEYRWSDRDYLAYDNVPLVGRVYPWSRRLYVASAFRKWGLSGGTAAAMMLHDHIVGRPNPWSFAFRPNRLSPIKSIPKRLPAILSGS